MPQVEAFIGGGRLPAYRSKLDHQYFEDTFERLKRKVACDLSHSRLLHRMIAEDQELVILLEDDVEISHGMLFHGQFESTRLLGS